MRIVVKKLEEIEKWKEDVPEGFGARVMGKRRREMDDMKRERLA